MNNKITKLQLKKHFQSLEKAELIEIILQACEHDVVKAHFDYCLNPNERELFEKCKQIIDNEFTWWDNRPPRMSFSVAKKTIADFVKFKPSKALIAELMIHFPVEVIACTYEYGEMSESFYTSAENNFDRALKYIEKAGLLDKFKDKAQLCVKYSSNCRNGFAETIRDMYDFYYTT